MTSTCFWHFMATSVMAATLISSSWAATSEKTIYNFTGGIDGGRPAAQLVFDSAGNAYGTTVIGGPAGCGTVFKLKPLSGGQWQESVLYSFSCLDDGKNPYGGVTLDSAGSLYGTTVAGGSGGICTGDGCGVVYKLTPSGGGWTESVLYSFTGGDDGFGPGGGVILDKAGSLYGTTPDGGAFSAGVVYQLSFSSGQWHQKLIHAFTGRDDGAVGSLGLLLLDSSGNLYGVTELGGKNSAGIVYKLAPGMGGTWNFTTLYAFKGQPDAAFPYGGLIADSSGGLYGTTYFGGTYGAGAVFQVRPAPTPTGWNEFVLYSFKGDTDGSNPTSTLVFDAARNLYGTTSTGGNPSCDCGTVFRLRPTGVIGWQESILYRFGTSDGFSPNYGLTPDGMGNYFGDTPAGGTQGQGVVFEITP
jgi:uncharacterized repeat protein (TIGR03803 family)